MEGVGGRGVCRDYRVEGCRSTGEARDEAFSTKKKLDRRLEGG
jgi:hypothetical protein